MLRYLIMNKATLVSILLFLSAPAIADEPLKDITEPKAVTLQTEPEKPHNLSKPEVYEARYIFTVMQMAYKYAYNINPNLPYQKFITLFKIGLNSDNKTYDFKTFIDLVLADKILRESNKIEFPTVFVLPKNN